MRPLQRVVIRVILPSAVAALGLSIAEGSAAESGDSCAAPAAAPGGAVETPVTLQIDPQAATKVVNFGADRDPESPELRVGVQNPEDGLPEGVEGRLEPVASPIVKVGEATESVSFPDPTYTPLDVSANRTRVTFRVCLDPPKDLPAGKYVGQITLEGPRGVDSTAATTTITLNAKNGWGFRLAMAVTLLAAFLVLLYKGAGEKRAAAIAEAAAKPGDTEAQRKEKAAAEKAAKRWRSAARATIGDPAWLVPALFALGGAFGVLWAVYASNPAWGEGGFVSGLVTLAGTGLAAVGAKSIFARTGS